MSADPSEGRERARFEQALKWCDDMRADPKIGPRVQALQMYSRRYLAEVVEAASRSLEQERDELRARVAELEPLTAFTDALRGKKVE